LALTQKLLIFCGLCCGVLAAQDATQRIPRQSIPTTGAIYGIIQNEQRLGLGGAAVTVQSLDTNQAVVAHTSGDGVFRVLNLQPGRYSVRAVLDGFRPFERDNLVIHAGELIDLSATLSLTSAPERKTIPDVDTGPSYRTLPKTPEGIELPPAPPLPPDDKTYTRFPDRWKFDWPDYRRYGPLTGVPNIPTKSEAMYIPGHLWDPFNRNKLKGDYPIIGQQTFLSVNLVSDTTSDMRRLPVPSGSDYVVPGSSNFFGRFGQFVLVQNFEFTFDLFHGDTSFKPIDWQIRITPDINVNYVAVRENGILNANPALGNTRLDWHASLQEAFVEKKLKDLSHNYDFVSARLGIQTFNSDFRGFIFFDQEPGARIFGNFHSNRFQYNLAYFAMLEKNTNSDLNTFEYRHQQVMIANVYKQDFFRPGYTIQASYHFNKEDPSIHYDDNDFLVRPSPIGAVFSQGRIQTNAIRAHYIGITGDGHFGRLNVEHAFYEVLGRDRFNVIANAFTPLNRWRDINAQMAALELSLDRDWLRYRVSAFWSSGSKRPGSSTERGFDSIQDNPDFAGGFFSFWVREGYRLLGTSVGLTQGESLIPDLRSSKSEGQSNFVNPGVFIYNAATDVKITPKWKGVFNLNLIRFDHPESLQLVEFQSPIHAGVGADSGLGIIYRPALSENLTLSGVFNAFIPFRGFKDIYTGSTLYSVAVNVRFRF
jgi:hypothetical protein